MKRDKVEAAADGRVFGAREALRLGLVDEIMPSMGRAAEMIAAEASVVIAKRKATGLIERLESLRRDAGVRA
jgi:ClpP class serine protease